MNLKAVRRYEPESQMTTVTVLPAASATPGGSTLLGTFSHDLDPEALETANHVLYHDIRDMLYRVGILDMQRVEIKMSGFVG
jgi:hypothetical protein